MNTGYECDRDSAGGWELWWGEGANLRSLSLCVVSVCRHHGVSREALLVK